ncbi:hypothetical protein [Actinocorallia populi]|uniref:hypothetical protein n=1 Tax=Actinocorallia populi TaxID=2079200 RepID=UPI000D089962|nr:hypothetical protein [Actinocorallia populi]
MRKQRIIMAGVVAATVVAAPATARAADGDEWRAIRPVVTLPTRDLRDVEAVSPTETWIAGYQYNHRSEAPDYFPILQRWNGRSWKAYEPTGIGFEGRLYALSAVGANDVWVAGSLEGEEDASYADTYLGHWDGTAWSRVAAPPVTEAGGRLRHMAADEGGVWLSELNGRVSRWDGTSWTTHLELGKRVIVLESFSSGEAWLRAEDGLYRWDGTSWSRVQLPAGAEPSHVRIDKADGVWTATPNGLAVWNNGSWQETPYPEEYRNRRVGNISQGHWVHLRDNEGPVSWLRWTGSDWTVISDESQNTPGRQVMTDSAGRIWGVAYAYLPFVDGTSGKLVRFENGRWKTVSGLPRAIYTLHAIPGSDKLIGVGVDGFTGDLKAITNG